MPTQVSAVPDSSTVVNGGSGLLWGVIGSALAHQALAVDDGDTTRVQRVGNGFNQNDAPLTLFKTFSGLPVGALVTRVGFVIDHMQMGTGTLIAVGYDLQSTGGFTGMNVGTVYTLLFAPQWRDVSGLGLLIPGGGTFQTQVALAVQQALNGAYYKATYLTLYLEYNQSPLAPTSLAVTPGTLVPTFSGHHNDPDGDPMFQVEIEVRRVSDNALFWDGVVGAAGSDFSVGYAGTTLVSGTQYQWRSRTTDNALVSNSVGAWSAFQQWTPTLNNPPVATQQAPAAGAIVGTATPTLQVGFTDPDAGDTFAGYQFQVRRQSDAVMFWDPGQVVTTPAQVSAAAAAVAYAGTALVPGIAYEWRVRVQDNHSAWSNYTGWTAFTVQTAPNPPSALTPSGLVNTLTPTVSGTYNQASGAAEAGYQYEVRQNVTTIYQSGDVAGAFATGQAYGTANAGATPAAAPALAWGTAYQLRARSKDTNAVYSDWTGWQDFHTNAVPTAPSNVAPNGAVVGSTTPTLSWTHNDPDGDAQTAADVELYDVTAGAYVAGYNPKNLAQSTMTHVVTTALTLTHQYQLRVRTYGLAGTGGAGIWSPAVFFTVATAPTVSVTAPTAGQVLTQSGQTVTWSMTGGSGTQQDYRVRVLASDQATVLYDSGTTAGTAVSFAVPAGQMRNLSTYYVSVILHDTLNQLAQSSNIQVTTNWTPPAAVAGLAVQAIGGQS